MAKVFSAPLAPEGQKAHYPCPRALRDPPLPPTVGQIGSTSKIFPCRTRESSQSQSQSRSRTAPEPRNEACDDLAVRDPGVGGLDGACAGCDQPGVSFEGIKSAAQRPPSLPQGCGSQSRRTSASSSSWGWPWPATTPSTSLACPPSPPGGCLRSAQAPAAPQLRSLLEGRSQPHPLLSLSAPDIGAHSA